MSLQEKVERIGKLAYLARILYRLYQRAGSPDLSTVCSVVIKTGFILLFILVPLILTPWNYELFEFNKMMIVYGLTTVIVGAWVIKMFAERQIRIARTPLDIPIMLFFVSQLVSTLFSTDPSLSWFGYYSRFNGGLWSIVCYILLYYAFVSNKIDVIRLLKVSLATAGIVAFYGVAQRLGIDKHLWVQDVQNRVFSTLGQPNWLAAYLVALIPIASGFALQHQMSKFKVQNNVKVQSSKLFPHLNFGFDLTFGFWICTTLLFFIVLLFTRSRSGLLAFAVADAVFWALLLTIPGIKKINSGNRLENRLKLFGIWHLAFGIIFFANGTHIDYFGRIFTRATPQTVEATPSGTLLETGGTESGTIRTYVWQGAVNAWRSSVKTMAIGTGTETFALAFYQFKPREHNLTSEWDFLYNKAHNEYLNYLATTGLFGLGSYVLIIGTFIFWFLKAQMSKLKVQNNVKAQSSKLLPHLNFGFDLTFELWILSIALFSGWLSILVTNFFGFSVVVIQLFFFLFPAMIFVLLSRQQKFLTLPVPLHDVSLKILSFATGISTLLVLIALVNAWRADAAYAAGYRANRFGNYPLARQALLSAASLNGAPPVYYDELATTLASLTVSAINEKQATAAAELAKESIEASDRAIAISPRNVAFWKTRTKIFYGFADFDPQFLKHAINAMNVALALAPQDPKILYNLAVLTGQDGDSPTAIGYFKQAIELKGNYRDAYWGLYVMYLENKQPSGAKDILRQYLASVDPNDKEFLEKAK